MLVVCCLFVCATARVSDRAFSAFSSPSSWSSLFRKVFNGDADDGCYQRDTKFHFRKLSSSSTAAHAHTHTCVLDSPEFIYNEMTDFFFRGFREVCCLLLVLGFFLVKSLCYPGLNLVQILRCILVVCNVQCSAFSGEGLEK